MAYQTIIFNNSTYDCSPPFSGHLSIVLQSTQNNYRNQKRFRSVMQTRLKDDIIVCSWWNKSTRGIKISFVLLLSGAFKTANSSTAAHREYQSKICQRYHLTQNHEQNRTGHSNRSSVHLFHRQFFSAFLQQFVFCLALSWQHDTITSLVGFASASKSYSQDSKIAWPIFSSLPSSDSPFRYEVLFCSAQENSLLENIFIQKSSPAERLAFCTC